MEYITKGDDKLKKFIPIIITIVFFIILITLYQLRSDDTVTSNNVSQDTTNITIDNKSENQSITSDTSLSYDNKSSETEQISNLAVDFLKAYYNIHSEDNSKNYALQHFEEYKIYMTERCQEQYKPKEVSDEENQNIGYSYNLDLMRYKIYSDIDFKNNDTESKVLCFIQTRTQLGEVKPNLSTALLNLSLKKENGNWLVDDIIINKLIDFPIKTDLLFE